MCISSLLATFCLHFTRTLAQRVRAVRLVAGSNALRRFKTRFFCLQIMFFFYVLLDCDLFEMNIS